MERFGPVFLLAGLGTFVLAFVVMAALPWLSVARIETRSIAEIAAQVTPEFRDLALDYPDEFRTAFGEPTPAAFADALERGKQIYIAEACWHCHSQFVRPVSGEDIRYGRVSTAAEYQNEMNLPHLFGTRRVGPDLSRQAGVHSNDWHVAHFYEPRWVVPWSVMPSYRWYYTEDKRPTRDLLSLVAYVQWLGSSERRVPLNMYNVRAAAEARAAAAAPPAATPPTEVK
jgi:cbb3-type cytochrome oxidase cytochrome c subunit